jgi:hypothetical protein
MSYRQITSGERYMISALRLQGLSQAAIARQLGRHRSSISREFCRNQCNDVGYRPSKADSRTRRRRSHSRHNWRFSDRHLQMVITLTAPGLQPRANRWLAAPLPHIPHQPPDHLPPHLVRPLLRRAPLRAPAPSLEETPKTAPSSTPTPPSKMKPALTCTSQPHTIPGNVA